MVIERSFLAVEEFINFTKNGTHHAARDRRRRTIILHRNIFNREMVIERLFLAVILTIKSNTNIFHRKMVIRRLFLAV